MRELQVFLSATAIFGMSVMLAHGQASIFAALREQLGMMLEARTSPIETLVIDHIERPTPD